MRQVCSSVSVIFDDHAVADFFDRQVDAGRRPQQVGRVWVHTHPGSGPRPSMTDEETFARVFGRTDWAVMFILARGGQTYARLQFHVGPGGWLLLPVEVEYRRPFSGSAQAAWHDEYLAQVQVEEWSLAMSDLGRLQAFPGTCGDPWDRADDFGLLDDLLLEDDLLAVPLEPRKEFAHDADF